MAWPADATKVHLDQGTDDPKQARAELADLVDKFNLLLDEAAGLGLANVFTADQTLEDTDAGAATGPILQLIRDSASPLAGDDLGEIRFRGQDLGSNLPIYAKILAEIVNPADGANDGRVRIHTRVSGADTLVALFQQGFFTATATGGDKGADTINASELYDDGVQIFPGPILGTEQATTSGTAINFTSIPSWVKKITVQFNQISTNGVSPIIIQIGDSGGLETSSYVGHGGGFTNSNQTSVVAQTAGYAIHNAGEAAASHSGSLTLTLEDAADNTWLATYTGFTTGGVAIAMQFGAGVKDLSATLDRLTLTTVGGSNTFDAGSINIIYE